MRVVSAPSEGAFFDQEPEYRQEVIPCGIPVMGLTAGLPAAFRGLLDLWGR